MSFLQFFPEQALNRVLGATANSVAKGDKGALISFGTFFVSERAAHEGRNPKNGEAIRIPAGKAVWFRASKMLASVVKYLEFFYSSPNELIRSTAFSL
jgi:DNA-binding protein HU-beta